MSKNGNDRLSGETPWMFDSGASCHMTGNPRALQRAKKTMPISIDLPNGATTVATHQGSVTLGDKLTLNNVLYVPTLQCNLISIAKLCKDMRCLVTFSDDNCVLQDCTSRTLIGAGKQLGGVYYYKEGSLGAIQVNSVRESSLWHNRLGHPSSEVLSFLSSSLGINFRKGNEVCEICVRAKQTRNKFIQSPNKAESVFELIHCDIWGPYKILASTDAHYFLTIVDDASRATWV